MNIKLSPFNAYFLTSSVLAAFLITLTIHSGGTLGPIPLFLLASLAFIITLTGELILAFITSTLVPCRHLIAIILGTITTALVLNSATSVFDVSAAHVFFCWAAFIICMGILLHSKSTIFSKQCKMDSIIDYAALSGIALFVLFWIWRESVSLQVLTQTGVLPVWVDYYLHGGQIVQFSDPKAIGHGTLMVAGAPRGLYHRGIFMIPAVVASVAHLPGLTAAMAILLPFGLFIMGIAIYCLGTKLHNPFTGITCLFFLLVLPDSSVYGLKNGFLGFHSSLFVAPGTAYGIAICLTSILFYITAVEEKSRALWVFSLALAISVFFFRAHFFLLYMPAFILATAFLICAHCNKHKFLLYFIASTLTAFVLIVTFSESANRFWLSHSVVLTFLDTIHLQRGVTTYHHLYTYLSNLHAPAIIIPSGIALYFIAALGAWILLYPFTLFAKVKRSGWDHSDTLPLAVFSLLIAIVLFAPAARNGDATEYAHRPFGLLYATVIIFSLSYIIKLLGEKRLTRFMQTGIASIFIVCILAAAYRPTYRPTKLLFRGSSLHFDISSQLNQDLFNISNYLKIQSKPGDTFMVSRDDMDTNTIDSASIISSISGMPAYLGRPALQSMVNSRLNSVVRERTAKIKSIANAKSLSQAFSLINGTKSTWYIAISPPVWDKDLKAPIFKSGKFSVYKTIIAN